jgi:vancomycin resistance protein YoaR
MKKSHTRLKIFFYLSLPITFLLVLLLMVGHLSWAKKYENKIYPGINIGTIPLGGLNKEEARTKINTISQKIEQEGIVFELNGIKINVPHQVTTDSIEFAQEAYQISPELSLEKAFNAGRENDWLTGFSRWLFGNYQIYHLKAEYTINEDVLKKFLKSEFSNQEVSSQNAMMSIDNQGELKIIPEKIGLSINYELAISETTKKLEDLDLSTIKLETNEIKPDTNAHNLENLISEAIKIGELAPIKIKAGEYFSIIDKKLLISWIKVDQNQKINLDQEKIKEFISKKLSIYVDQEVETPRFEIKNGKMSFWQAGKEGKKINIEQSSQQIISSILIDQKKEIIVEPEVIPFASLDNGEIIIKELLGTGHSNFVGSPSNRKKNIAVGAKSVHGLLIKPGEEFSLVKALGEINEKSGYFPELVIKGNKTVPEFGGGLCQVATTLFRSALVVGLPITARQNHSYRVSYYEPAGTDAAVYDPQPDIKFLNDTGNYILIQTRITGNDIYFDFWGTKDGRKATSTTPTVYNIVKPPATKTIVSSDLKPGEKKCTESAHNGADAFFDYSVIYPDGTNKEKRFKSHYIPWQAVCLVGASSTPATINPLTTTTPTTSSTAISTSTKEQ